MWQRKAPNDKESLIGTENFHFSHLNDSQKGICRELLLPLVDKIFISKGKPIVYANNQNWWLVAVTVVIAEFLNTEQFEFGDEAEIWIDNRNSKTFGLVSDINSPEISFEDYHNIIKKQIEGYLKTIVNALSIKLNIIFLSDTTSFFINLADVVCGLVRTEESIIKKPVIKCSCSKFMSGDDPVSFIGNNPMTALSLIFQEIYNDKLNNISLVKQIIARMRKDLDNYHLVWVMFYDLLKTKIGEREIQSSLVRIKPFVEIFIDEYNRNRERVSGSIYLELMTLFVEYYSHIGATETPYTKELFLRVIQQSDVQSETRLLRKWEKYVSFSLRNVQIMFNAYNFDNAVSEFENLWEEQETIIRNLTPFFQNKNDEPTTAIIGTLAQSYAYSGEYDKAIDYLEMSKEYAIKTLAKTDSYLFTIYHRKKEIAKCREYFQKQTGNTPEGYAKQGDYTNVWNLLSYCKLRALELYVNKTTNLSKINLKNFENSEYPFPLIQKWDGIALWLENSISNSFLVEKYFTDAISNLQKEGNGFSIKALSLPIIQCYALINKDNMFHKKYNTFLDELKRQSKTFEQFVNEKAVMLNNINNDNDMWNRALSLPFIYA
jgi:hypothetical protein